MKHLPFWEISVFKKGFLIFWMPVLATCIPMTMHAEGVKLTFQEHVKTLKSEKAGEKQIKGILPEENSDAVMTVTLWPSVLSVDDGKKNTLYDFHQRRIFILDNIHKTYEEYSLYFEIGYREAEFANRLFMQGAFKAGGEVPQEFETFQLETLFGLRNWKEKSLDATLRNTGPSSLEFNVPGGEIVAKTEFNTEKIPVGLQGTWDHFLLYGCSLHPSILSFLGKDGRFLKSLWYQSRNVGDTKQVSLTQIHREKAPDPDNSWRKTYKRTEDSDPELWVIVQKALAAVPAPDVAETQKTIQDFVDKAAQEGRTFDATLACLECPLQTGQRMDKTLKTLVTCLRGDPNMRLFQEGLSTKSPAEAEQAIQALKSINRKGLQKDYIIDIMLGDAYETDSQYKEAIESYFKALRANPFLAGPWKDLGDVYGDNYEMELAWLCWDTARYLYPNHPLLQAVTDEEKNLVKDHPEYF